MDKYIEKNLDKIIVAVVVVIVHYIRQLIKFKQQRQATSQPNYDTDNQEDYFPLPEQEHQIPTTPMQSTVTAASSPRRPLPPRTTPIYRKLIVTPLYPGIKKLVLPTQEQDPYKLYQATSPKQTHQLTRLLNKYKTTQQAAIMHEIFTPKA